MDLLDKIYETLQVDKLDEEQQKEVKQTVSEAVEMKAKEMAKEISENVVEEYKEELAEQYENKYEEYKDNILSKFSNFVDDILEQELYIPEKVKEYARLGEQYEDVIEAIKTKLAIDEGVLSDEVKNLLKESRDEIKKLKNDLNEARKERYELSEDAKDMAANIYLRKKCDGLPEKTKQRVMNLLEDVRDKEEIDRKFDLFVEHVKKDDSTLTEEEMYCKDCGTEVEVNEDDKEEKTCPECGGDLTIKESKKGKEDVRIDERDKETDTQHNYLEEQWLRMLHDGRL